MTDKTYAIRVKDKVPTIGGLFLVDSTPEGEKIRLFATKEAAVYHSKFFDSVEVIEYSEEDYQ